MRHDVTAEVKKLEDWPLIEELLIEPYVDYREHLSSLDGTELTSKSISAYKTTFRRYAEAVYQTFGPTPDLLFKVIGMSLAEFAMIADPLNPADPIMQSKYQRMLANEWRRIFKWINSVLPVEGKLPRAKGKKTFEVIAAARESIEEIFQEYYRQTAPWYHEIVEEASKTLDPTGGRTITFFDFFSGPGGFTAGLTSSGLIPKYALDWDKDTDAAAWTYQANWPHVTFYHSRIEDWLKAYKKGTYGKIEIDLVVAGPPCQPFSGSGSFKGPKDRRNRLPEFVEAIKLLTPRVFILENVGGLKARWPEYFQNISGRLEKLGYHLAWDIINVADWGLPQNRRRLVIVGCKDGYFRFPKILFGHRVRPDLPWLPSTTVEDTLEELSEDWDVEEGFGTPNNSGVNYNPDWKQMRPRILPDFYDSKITRDSEVWPIDPNSTVQTIKGGANQHWFDTQGFGENYWTSLSILKEAEIKESQRDYDVSVIARRAEIEWQTRERGTFYGPEFYDVWWDEDHVLVQMKKGPVTGARPLTWQECGALQGFPPTYKWITTEGERGEPAAPEEVYTPRYVGDVFKMIGNAVPTNLGFYLAQGLLEQELL